MRVAVVGAGGFIGTHLSAHLTSESFELIPISRRDAPSFDFASPETYREQLFSADAVVLLVSASTPGHSGGIAFEIERNVLPHARFLEALDGTHVGKVVYLSSGGTVYGRQMSSAPMTEEVDLRPTSTYGMGKLLVEQMLRTTLLHSGVDWTILRPSNPVGTQQGKSGVGLVAKVVSSAVRRTPMEIWGDGSIVRDYFDVRDLSTAIALVLRSDASSRQTFNVSSAIGRSVREIVTLVEEITGLMVDVKYMPSRAADVPTNVLSYQKIAGAVHWSPMFDLRSTIQELHQWESSRPIVTG